MSESYKVLAISDIHMSNKLPHAHPGKDGVTDRLQDQIRLWDNVAKHVRSYKVDCVLILGDLFDKSLVDAVTLTTTVKCIVDLPCNVRILPGNHDAASVTGGRFTVEAFGAMDKEHIRYLRPEVMFSPCDWLHFYPVPFGPSAPSMEQIEKAKLTAERHQEAVNVLLLHHSIIGCSHLGWTCDDGLDSEEVCDGFDAVLAGHFHEHQRFGPDLQGMYLGAPMHHRYDDVGRSAQYWILTFTPDGEIDEEAVDPGLPKFRRVEIRDSEITEPPEVLVGDFLRYDVHATHAEWASLKPQIIELCGDWRGKQVNASFKHKPIYHHESRLGTPIKAGAGIVKMDQHVRTYADKARTDSLDRDRLLEMGLGMLAEARVDAE